MEHPLGELETKGGSKVKTNYNVTTLIRLPNGNAVYEMREEVAGHFYFGTFALARTGARRRRRRNLVNASIT